MIQRDSSTGRIRNHPHLFPRQLQSGVYMEHTSELIPLDGKRFNEKAIAKPKHSEVLISESYFENNRYSAPWYPGVLFFANLASSEGVKVQAWIPETIVYNVEERPFWLYTNPEGFIEKTSAFTEKQVLGKLLQSPGNYEITAVHKTSELSRNRTKALTPVQIKNEFSYIIRTQTDAFCFQRYVKGKGSKPSICRTALINGQSYTSWVITSIYDYKHEVFLANCSSSYVTPMRYGKFLKDTSEIVRRLVLYFKTAFSMNFSELACDFIKDENGKWWLINIKAFKFESLSPQKLNIDYGIYKKCAFCRLMKVPNRAVITVRMMTELIRQLKLRNKMPSWLKNKTLHPIESSNLNQNINVCHDCYQLFAYCKELHSIETAIGNAFDFKPSFVDRDRKLVHLDESLIQYRLLVNLNRLDEWKIKKLNKITVRYALLGQEVSYEIENRQRASVILNKLKLFYVFCRSSRDYSKFLTEQRIIKVELLCNQAVIGEGILHLNDFRMVNSKQYYSLVSTPIPAYLKASVFSVSDAPQKVSGPFYQINGVFVPSFPYISPHPFPDEWFTIMSAKRSQSTRILRLK